MLSPELVHQSSARQSWRRWWLSSLRSVIVRRREVGPQSNHSEIRVEAFIQLYRRLLGIDFFGTAGEALPHGPALAEVIREGAARLPELYAAEYASPLQSSLSRLLQLVAARELDATTLEALTGAVYQHRQRSREHGAIDRFLAVISDLFRSFLDAGKRAKADVPLRQTLPPLAMFQHDGHAGPFTITVEQVERLIQSKVGVVTMPATYANHPLIWASLAHETGGHDVTHADPGLLTELAVGIPSALADIRTGGLSRDQLALLWSYWIDEASADVYGLLNIGPAFAPNQAAFFAAIEAEGDNPPPRLRMISKFDPRDPNQILDPHPTDILRLHLAAGVIGTLTHLSSQTRTDYIKLLDDLAGLLTSGDTLAITGNVPIGQGRLQPIEMTVPLNIMAETARNVGGFIATAKLDALNGRSIQQIETWDDPDEARATSVKEALLEGRPIGDLGDDADLLAGATMALLERPALYDRVTAALNNGLNLSFERDPIWGPPPKETV
jgi:hypothetical protein